MTSRSGCARHRGRAGTFQSLWPARSLKRWPESPSGPHRQASGADNPVAVLLPWAPLTHRLFAPRRGLPCCQPGGHPLPGHRRCCAESAGSWPWPASSRMECTSNWAVQAETSLARSGVCPRMSSRTIIASQPRTMQSEDTRRACCSSVSRSRSGSTARSIQSTRRWPRLGLSAGGFAAIRATILRRLEATPQRDPRRCRLSRRCARASRSGDRTRPRFPCPQAPPWLRPGAVGPGESAYTWCGGRLPGAVAISSGWAASAFMHVRLYRSGACSQELHYCIENGGSCAAPLRGPSAIAGYWRVSHGRSPECSNCI